MSWLEVIKMRALKEELFTESTILIGVDRYDQAITEGLRTLGNQERQAVFLRFWEALPIARVADRMELSWTAADNLIDSALQKLRRQIKKYHFTPGSEIQEKSEGVFV